MICQRCGKLALKLYDIVSYNFIKTNIEKYGICEECNKKFLEIKYNFLYKFKKKTKK